MSTQDQPQHPSQSVTVHWVFLGAAAAIIAASFLLATTAGRLTLPGSSTPLPSLCMYRNLTGFHCPGCGLSRAFVCIAHGDLAGSWSYNPAAILVFALVASQIPYRAGQLWRIRRGLPQWEVRRLSNILIAIVVIALLAQWLVRLVLGLSY